MDAYIKVHQKKLNILLLTVSAICYYKVYFTTYKWIVFDLLTLKMETIVVLDMILLQFLYSLWCPALLGLNTCFVNF